MNLAARAAKVAEPSSVLVDRETNAALAARDTTSAGDTFALEGFAEPVELYRVRRVG